MAQTELDKEEFRAALGAFLCEYFGIGDLKPDTPMHVIREKAELIGTMLGRSTAVCLHDGPIGVDIVMKIRSSEHKERELLLRIATNLCGPGGQLRELMSKRAETSLNDPPEPAQ